jgi:uncharacterized Zn finger protein
VSDGGYPPPSRPIAVDGGIKARSQRGAIGRSWWSERFVQVLEGIGVGGRMQRGRNYARRGQVLSFAVEPGTVAAEVQGSRSRPYRVRASITAYGEAEWSRLERALAGDAWYTAKLLAGEMPEDIETVFADQGLPLFPRSAAELSMACSCPDHEVPCKHIAAVFYLLAEAFDEDPFTILAWRGRERAALLANVGAARADRPAAADAADAGLSGHTATAPPLDADLGSFFSLQAPLPTTSPATVPSTALLDQLAPLGTVRGRSLNDLLRPAYLALGAPGTLGTLGADDPRPSDLPRR